MLRLNIEYHFVEKRCVAAVLFTNVFAGIVVTPFVPVDVSDDNFVEDDPVYVGCYEVVASNPFYEITSDEDMTVEVSACVVHGPSPAKVTSSLWTTSNAKTKYTPDRYTTVHTVDRITEPEVHTK